MANLCDSLDVVDTWVFGALDYRHIPHLKSVAEEITERETRGFEGVIAPFGHQPIPWRIGGQH